MLHQTTSFYTSGFIKKYIYVSNFNFLNIRVSSNGLKLRKRVFNKHNIGDAVRSSFCPMVPAQENVCVVCSGCDEGWVGIFDMENDDKPLVNRLQGHSTVVLDVSFNYDESLLASGDKQVKVLY
jgi:WD40 repeat protein